MNKMALLLIGMGIWNNNALTDAEWNEERSSSKSIVNINSTSVSEDYSWFTRKGTSTLSGQIFLRQAGGGVVTAAGEDVTLMPLAIPFEQWALFQALRQLRADVGGNTDDETDAIYLIYRRRVKADADGRFVFRDLPAGKYLIVSRVVWHVAGDRQGGYVRGRVELKAGESASIIINEEI